MISKAQVVFALVVAVLCIGAVFYGIMKIGFDAGKIAAQRECTATIKEFREIMRTGKQ